MYVRSVATGNTNEQTNKQTTSYWNLVTPLGIRVHESIIISTAQRRLSYFLKTGNFLKSLREIDLLNLLIFYPTKYCISCINYSSNKLSFIQWVLNKPYTRNSLGQRLVVVSCGIFQGFHLLFCPLCLMCEVLFKHVVDNKYDFHLIQ